MGWGVPCGPGTLLKLLDGKGGQYPVMGPGTLLARESARCADPVTTDLDPPDVIVTAADEVATRVRADIALMRTAGNLLMSTTNTRPDIDLPLFTPEHENKLLVTALAPLRPCPNGLQCVVVTLGPPSTKSTNGAPLVESLTPESLEVALRDGTLPKDPAPCILCVRFAVSTAISLAHITRGSSSIPTSAPSYPPSINMAGYQNPVGPGGYRSAYCNHPDKTNYNGITAPVAMFCAAALSVVDHPTIKGHFAIDQSMMLQPFE